MFPFALFLPSLLCWPKFSAKFATGVEFLAERSEGGVECSRVEWSGLEHWTGFEET